MTSTDARIEVPRGTLEMLILRIVELAPAHGYGLSKRLEQISGGAFRVNPGSMFPALHQMEEAGWIRGEWGLSENNRRAKHYAITPAGRHRLGEERRSWQRVTGAVDLVLGAG